MAFTTSTPAPQTKHSDHEGWKSLPEIVAHAYSDDHRIEVAIDARPWLFTATLKNLQHMDAIEWGGDYEADEIYHTAERSGCSGAKRLSDYLASNPTMPNGDTVGFEVRMEPTEAYDWLKKHRSELLAPTPTENADVAPLPAPSASAGHSGPLLTRKMVGAIARAFAADSNRSYLQCIDVVAKAIGFQNQATLMSVLGEAEKRRAESVAMTASAEQSTVVIAFGQGLASQISYGELLGQSYDGAISERSFDSPAEAEAYIRGLEDMDGWMEFGFAAVKNVPGYAVNEEFFADRSENPDISFEQFHDARVKRMMLEDEDEDDLEP